MAIGDRVFTRHHGKGTITNIEEVKGLVLYTVKLDDPSHSHSGSMRYSIANLRRG